MSKLRLPLLAFSGTRKAKTQDIIPIVAIDADVALLRQGTAVVVLDVVGPNLEYVSEARQKAALHAWEDTLRSIRCDVSHHLIVDDRASFASERYFAERSRELAAVDTKLATVAAEWATHIARQRIVRCRSLLVCSRALPTTVSSIDHPDVNKTVVLLREETEHIIAALHRQRWAARRLTGAEIESAVRELFDPFGRRVA